MKDKFIKNWCRIVFPEAGSTVGLVVYLSITAAEQIRCSRTSQDHIFHSTQNHCHSLALSLTQSCLSFFLPHTRSSLTHSCKRQSLNLEELKDNALFPFGKGGG